MKNELQIRVRVLHIIRCLSILAGLMSMSASAQSADPCSALLAQGIYDAFDFASASVSESSFHRALCATDDTTITEARRLGVGGNAGLDVLGILTLNLGGDVQRSKDFIQAYKRSFCGVVDAANLDANSRSVFQRTASPVVLNAFVSCIQTAKSGFKIQHQRVNDNVITFTLSFSNNEPTVASGARFDQWVVTPREAAKCTSPNLDENDLIDKTAKTIQCTRTQGRRDEFVVSIHTSGGVYSYIMPALPIPNQSASTPFGTVMAYAGKVPPAGWKVCDGSIVSRRKCPDLYAVIGYSFGGGSKDDEFRLPDLQGRFVRGLNGAATGEGRDPEGVGRELGSAQASMTSAPKTPFKAKRSGEHVHRIHDGYFAEVDCGRAGYHGSAVGDDHDNNICREWINSEPGGAHEHELEGGDAETRPANIALNYIIHTGIGCASP